MGIVEIILICACISFFNILFTWLVRIIGLKVILKIIKQVIHKAKEEVKNSLGGVTDGKSKV